MQSLLCTKNVVDVVGSSRPLTYVRYEDTISSALKKLETAQVFGALVRSGPVFVGIIDMKDIVRSLMKFTRTGFKDFSTESAKNLEDESKMFTQQVVGGILSPETLLVRVTRSSPLRDAVTKMVEGNTRRLVVVDEHGKIVNVITQFDIVKFLFENVCDFGGVHKETVGSLSLGTIPVICGTLLQCAAEAFQLMISKNVRSIGIINNSEDRELVANLSLSDLKCLNQNNFAKLADNVFEFLLNTKDTLKSVVCCTASDSLQDVLSQLVDNKIHRVYVVDRYQRPYSVISLVDILNLSLQL